MCVCMGFSTVGGLEVRGVSVGTCLRPEDVFRLRRLKWLKYLRVRVRRLSCK